MQVILKINCHGRIKVNNQDVTITEASMDKSTFRTHQNFWISGKIIDSGEPIKIEFPGNVLDADDLRLLKVFLTNDT